MAKVYYIYIAIPSDKKRRRKEKTHAVFNGGKAFKVYRLMGLLDQAVSG